MNSGYRLVFDPSHGGGGGGGMFLLDSGSSIFRGDRSSVGITNQKKRLPFFTSAEEMLEEEYYDEQLLPEKKRRLTPDQVQLLERSFDEENKLEPERKSELARKLGLPPRQVAVWFQNRRARWKTKTLERDFDRLKASYDALLADRDALFADNDRLRTQVASLTEMLQTNELVASPGGPKVDSRESPAALTSDDVAAVNSIHLMQQQQQQQKVKDRLSMGSGGSAVVDSEGAQLQVDSSGDSYFQDSYQQGGCRVGVQSEDASDCGSDEGCSYLPTGLFVEGHHTDGWWVWN